MIDGLKTTTAMVSGVMVSATINASGNLIITLSNGQTINAGAVRGASGSAGPVGNKGDKGDSGTPGAPGSVGPTGPQGIQGPRGNNGQSFEIDRVGTTVEKAQFDYEPEGFSFLAVEPTSTKLYIKKTAGQADWFAGIDFATPLQGPKGDKGDPGIPGPTGATGQTGKGLQPDQRGLTDARSIYDAEDPGFIFYDYQANVFFVKMSTRHGHWSAAYSMMQGPQGIQGPQGAGIRIDEVIDTTFVAANYSSRAAGTHLYSNVDKLLYIKLDVNNNNWSFGVSVKGDKGEKGDGIRFDTSINNPIELQDYNKKPMGFMVLHTNNAVIFIKNYDYPYPGQDQTLDYSKPEYNTPDYKTKKQYWDNLSESERLDFLWSTSQITRGVQGIQGVAGPTGAKGDQGDKGLQGTGFIADYKGPGVTPRKAYDALPAGTSYLDTTYGMLYFRQSDTIGQWGPAIPIANTGGNLNSIEYISHGLMVDPQNQSTIQANNVLRIKSVNTDTSTTTSQDIFLSGTSYAQYLPADIAAAGSGLSIKYLTTVAYGTLIRPEIWTPTLFDSGLAAVYRLQFVAQSNTYTKDIGTSDIDGGITESGKFELSPIIVDSSTVPGLTSTDTNIRVYAAVAFTGTTPTAGDLRLVINQS